MCDNKDHIQCDEEGNLIDTLFDDVGFLRDPPKIKMVKDVYIFKNGLVSVMDEKDRQVVTFQGVWKEKAKDIFKACTHETLFYDQREDEKI